MAPPPPTRRSFVNKRSYLLIAFTLLSLAYLSLFRANRAATASFGGDWKHPTITQLTLSFQHARKAQQRQLEQAYGRDLFKGIFQTKSSTAGSAISRGALLLNPSAPSYHRFVDRLAIQILGILAFGSTDHDDVTLAFLGSDHAAGYGNLHREAYPAVVDHFLRPVLESLHLEGYVNNYAMGYGSTSAPETALCLESIVGKNPLLVVWDYPNDLQNDPSGTKVTFFCYRAALQGRACLVVADNLSEKQKEGLKQLEEHGATILLLQPTEWQAAWQAIPDTLHARQSRHTLAPWAQYLKCGTQFEAPDTPCAKHQFTDQICPRRPHQAVWRHGWRWHGLQGSLLAVLLTDLLEATLQSLEGMTNYKQQLAQLKAQYFENVKQVNSAPIPSVLANNLLQDLEKESHLSLEQLLKHSSTRRHFVCHTARAPSQLRRDGLVAYNHAPQPVNHHDGEYPRGIFISDWQKSNLTVQNEPRQHGLLPLIRGDVLPNSECSEWLNIDSRDYFSVRNVDGAQRLHLPVARAIDGRKNKNKHVFLGLIAICLLPCENNCNEEDRLGIDDISPASMRIAVNGEAVFGLHPFLNDCHFLQSAGEGYYWEPNDKGAFDMELEVLTADSYMQISSVLLW